MFCCLIGVCQSDFSVGTWRDHLPYSKVNAIAKVGAFMYASTPYSLVEFNIEDNEDVEKVYLNFNNSLPIDLHLNIINPINNDSIVKNQHINSAIVDNEGFVLESSNTNVELNYDNLIGTEKLLINANISSTDMTDDIRLSNLNKLIFSLSVKYKNRIN